MKGNLRTGVKSGLLRKILVISQFSISIFFIIGSMIVHSQLDYFRNKDLGFDKNNLMIVRLFLTGNNQEDFVNTIRVLKNEIQNHREVKFVSSSIGVPGGLRPIVQYRNPEDPGSQYQYLAQVPIDYNYIPAMNIQLKDGRNFSRDFITDNANAVILNEVSVEKLGLSEPVVGKTVDVLQGGLNGSAVKRTVIGVIKNMNYEPLRRKTEPMALVLAPDGGGSLLIKITGENIPETIDFTRNTWQKIVPDRPFEYSFLDEDLSNLYIAEANFSHATNSFTILAIIIAGLGLFGLASFTAEQRTKEIGIRKVMGAPVGRIMFILTREFFYLVMISNIFAWPLAYYFASKWIQNFAFHISLSPAPFFLSGVLALAIAVLTVGGQAFKAAMINPAESLRYE
ncbi:ABC transporter permease [candidate division KSB1 bacterium]